MARAARLRLGSTGHRRLDEGVTMSYRSDLRNMMRIWLWPAIGLLLASSAVSAKAEDDAPSPGEALYQARCASCHEGGVARAPDKNALQQLSAERIGFALGYGLMSQQAKDLSQREIAAIVRYL